jgi:hypothetical protein
VNRAEPNKWSVCKHCGEPVVANPMWIKADGSPMYCHVVVKSDFCMNQRPTEEER